jgi:hypothetical protein
MFKMLPPHSHRTVERVASRVISKRLFLHTIIRSIVSSVAPTARCYTTTVNLIPPGDPIWRVQRVGAHFVNSNQMAVERQFCAASDGAQERPPGTFAEITTKVSQQRKNDFCAKR